MRWYPGPSEENHAQLGRYRLKRRHQFLTEGHEEKQVEEREHEPARNTRAKQGKHTRLKHHHKACVADQRNPRRFAEDPAKTR